MRSSEVLLGGLRDAGLARAGQAGEHIGKAWRQALAGSELPQTHNTQKNTTWENGQSGKDWNEGTGFK